MIIVRKEKEGERKADKKKRPDYEGPCITF